MHRGGLVLGRRLPERLQRLFEGVLHDVVHFDLGHLARDQLLESKSRLAGDEKRADLVDRDARRSGPRVGRAEGLARGARRIVLRAESAA